MLPRQREIRRLTSHGHTRLEIAEALQIHPQTVTVHRIRARERLKGAADPLKGHDHPRVTEPPARLAPMPASAPIGPPPMMSYHGQEREEWPW